MDNHALIRLRYSLFLLFTFRLHDFNPPAHYIRRRLVGLAIPLDTLLLNALQLLFDYILMSPRRTRSSARHAASQADTSASPSSGAASTNTSPAAPQSASQAPPSQRQTPVKPSLSRKRKAQGDDNNSPPPPRPQQELAQPASSTRRPKRQKVQEPAAIEPPSQPAATRTSTRTRKGKATVAMSSPDEYVITMQLKAGKCTNFSIKQFCPAKLAGQGSFNLSISIF